MLCMWYLKTLSTKENIDNFDSEERVEILIYFAFFSPSLYESVSQLRSGCRPTAEAKFAIFQIS